MTDEEPVLPRWKQAIYHAGCMFRHAGLVCVELWRCIKAMSGIGAYQKRSGRKSPAA